jgi:D-alanyl-lipoteichoic acid acyltransferase DltB (MBOAT superfamily)
MDVPSLQFLGFALVGAILFNLWRNDLWGEWVLLVWNVGFFCTFLHGPAMAVPYLAFLAVGYVGVLCLQRKSTPVMFWGLLAVMLFAFFWLKHYTFIPKSIWITTPYTMVGLSYVFFRVLHLIIDAGQGGLPATISPLRYVNYTMNFTALVSGPIQFYPDYDRYRRTHGARLDLFALARAFERIVLGFFKIAIIAMLLSRLQHGAMDQLSAAAPLWKRTLDFAVVWASYPVFLYFNFSGYTDFVIGVARLFRIRMPENFDRPFLAENFISFWGRWHITLSNWLKTYVYTPLLMTLMRRVPSPSVEPYLGVVAYFVTFFLVGAWHGQTSMFLVFGVLQGGGVAANKLYQVVMTARLGRSRYRSLTANPVYRAWSRGLTFTWFAFTMFWFWSSWPQLGGLVAAAGWDAVALAFVLVLGGAAGALSLLNAAIKPRAQTQAQIENAGEADERPSPSRYWRAVATTAMVVIILASTLILASPAPDLVYKHF